MSQKQYLAQAAPEPPASITDEAPGFSGCPCPLCSSREQNFSGRADKTYTLHTCRVCGFVFSAPRPSLDLLMAFYNQHTDYNTVPLPLAAPEAKKRASRYAEFIRKFHPRAKRVLEIGCLHGDLLFGLRQWGYDVAGADVCESSRLFAKQAYGIQVYPGESPPSSLTDSFDAVILSHVIEHILDPVSFLTSAASFLAPGGIMLVETPGLGTPMYSVFGATYNMIRPPEHISFFTTASLRQAIAQAGLIDESSWTYSPIWDQRNIVFYSSMSLLKRIGALNAIRERRTPCSSHGLAAPMHLKQGSLMDRAFRIFDYACRALHFLFTPVVRVLDTNDRGLMLVALGRKPTAPDIP